MERRWRGNNINLDTICAIISKFFEEKNFRVHVKRFNKRIDLIIIPQTIHKILEYITVVIKGTPNDFTIRFEAGKRSHKITFLGRITQLFGGGILFLYGQKSEEELEKLEKEFWDFIYVAIEHLTKR